MKRLFSVIFLICIGSQLSFSQSLAEKLGYSKDTKLLIIHADDLGVSHSENKATFEALKYGVVNSTSMMLPPAWSEEVGKMAQELPDLDIGIHITLTNEWENFNWGPIAGKAAVPGLVNEKGFMYADCEPVTLNAKPAEIEAEIRAQIKAANQMGITPTHLDSHMGCIFFGRPEYMRAYLKIADELSIPAMLNRDMVEGIIKPNAALFEGIDVDRFPLVDQLIMANPTDFEGGMSDFYIHALNKLQAGFNIILIHLAFDDEEMNAVTTGHDSFHAPWRQADFDFFTSEKVKEILKK